MKSITFYSLIFLVLFTTNGCESDKASDYVGPLFEDLPSSKTGISFTNAIKETEENHHLIWESIYNGGGVAVGDINNDGLMDIYFGGNMVEDKLYLNKGNFEFEDITQLAGIDESTWTAGINMIDINQDGWVDIYLNKMSWYKDDTNQPLRNNRLYLNQGDNTFKEVASQLGVNDSGHSTQSSFFDFDKDGDLDLYVMNAPSHRYDQKLDYINSGQIPYEFKDHFYINNSGVFVDATEEVIGSQEHAYGLGLVTLDLNQDGWTDIYVANDFEKPDLFLINDKKGGFKNLIFENLRHISYSSMGMDVGDINNDGFFDVGVLDMQSNDHVRSKTNMPSMDIQQFWTNVSRGFHFQFMSNMLQLNNGSGFYSEIAQLAGIASTDWSWSILFADFDNDTKQDISITNGIDRNIKDNDFNNLLENNPEKSKKDLFELSKKTNVEPISNFAYRNNGDLTFSDVSDSWNFNNKGFSYGAAYADLNNDGALDLVVSNNNAVASIYRNKNSSNHFIKINVKRGNETALNSIIRVVAGNQTQIREVHPVRGYQSSSTAIAHFGLGHINLIDSIIITSSYGDRKVLTGVKVDQTITVDIINSRDPIADSANNKPLFSPVENNLGIQYFHVENEFNDFDHQILIPHMESRNGPCSAVGDVNGDGFEDIYMGASKNDFGLIYLQRANGQMVYKPNPIFEEDKVYEDIDANFFDVDKDGDLDLYVSSGGSEYEEGSALYEDRLYINDGRGNFSKSSISLPRSNSGKVIIADFNKDNFDDVFIGGRMKGKSYPYGGDSHILINKNRILTADTSFNGKELGMITDAIAVDINEDDRKDLVITGEWMRPTFLINHKSGWKNETDRYLSKSLNGWWFSINQGDIDGDGEKEIILGNMGINNKYKASEKKPIRVYAADFNDDEKSDIVLAKNSKYGEVPVRGFECSSEQLPYLKDKFSSYNSFAHAEVKDLIDTSKAGSIKLEANEFRSGYLKKKGDKYEFIPFKNQLQLAPIRSIIIEDINQDGIQDIVTAGNMFEAEVETVRHDASIGNVVLGGKKLDYLNLNESGFYAAGNVRDLEILNASQKRFILVMNNNTKPQLFKVQ